MANAEKTPAYTISLDDSSTDSEEEAKHLSPNPYSIPAKAATKTAAPEPSSEPDSEEEVQFTPPPKKSVPKKTPPPNNSSVNKTPEKKKVHFPKSILRKESRYSNNADAEDSDSSTEEIPRQMTPPSTGSSSSRSSAPWRPNDTERLQQVYFDSPWLHPLNQLPSHSNFGNVPDGSQTVNLANPGRYNTGYGNVSPSYVQNNKNSQRPENPRTPDRNQPRSRQGSAGSWGNESGNNKKTNSGGSAGSWGDNNNKISSPQNSGNAQPYENNNFSSLPRFSYQPQFLTQAHSNSGNQYYAKPYYGNEYYENNNSSSSKPQYQSPFSLPHQYIGNPYYQNPQYHAAMSSQEQPSQPARRPFYDTLTDEEKKSKTPASDRIAKLMAERSRDFASRGLTVPYNEVVVLEHVVETIGRDPRPNAFFDNQLKMLRVYHGPHFGNPFDTLIPRDPQALAGTPVQNASNAGYPNFPGFPQLPEGYNQAMAGSVPPHFNAQYPGQALSGQQPGQLPQYPSQMPPYSGQIPQYPGYPPGYPPGFPPGYPQMNVSGAIMPSSTPIAAAQDVNQNDKGKGKASSPSGNGNGNRDGQNNQSTSWQDSSIAQNTQSSPKVPWDMNMGASKDNENASGSGGNANAGGEKAQSSSNHASKPSDHTVNIETIFAKYSVSPQKASPRVPVKSTTYRSSPLNPATNFANSSARPSPLKPAASPKVDTTTNKSPLEKVASGPQWSRSTVSAGSWGDDPNTADANTAADVDTWGTSAPVDTWGTSAPADTADNSGGDDPWGTSAPVDTWGTSAPADTADNNGGDDPWGKSSPTGADASGGGDDEWGTSAPVNASGGDDEWGPAADTTSGGQWGIPAAPELLPHERPTEW